MQISYDVWENILKAQFKRRFKIQIYVNCIQVSNNVLPCLQFQFAAEWEAAGRRVSASRSEVTVLNLKMAEWSFQVREEPQAEELKLLEVLVRGGALDELMDRKLLPLCI